MTLARLLMAAAMIAFASMAAASDGPERQNHAIKLTAEAQREIRTAEITRKRVTGFIATTAMVDADATKIAHVTPRIQARVVRLVADLGQRVKPGDQLVVMSSLELGQAKTEYLRARSLEQISKRNLDREERLFSDKIAAEKDVLEARARHDEALAQYRSARERLRLLISAVQLDQLTWSENGQPLSEFSLVAPVAGTIVSRNLTVGSIIAADADVITIIDLDKVWVLANVYENDLAQVRVGATATITCGAYPDQSFSGTVTYVGDTVDQKTRTIPARIEVSNTDHRLKPGMFANADISGVGKRRDVLAAPASAIYEIDGKKVVFVQTAPNTFAPRSVALGEEGHGDVEIGSGVSEGEAVVVQGGLVLKALLVNRGD